MLVHGTEITKPQSTGLMLVEKVGVPLLWITLGFILAKWTGRRGAQ